MSTVIRSPNWIGDGIMSLPAIRAFKEHFPAERLVVAAKRYLADIYLNIPEIDEIIPLPDRWTARSFFCSLKEFRQRRFDHGILFTNSFSSALFFRLAGVRSSIGYSRDGRGWLMQDRVLFSNDYGHHQHYYLKLIEHLAGNKIDKVFPADLVVTTREKEQAVGWLREQGVSGDRSLLAVSPTAAYGSAKAWPPDRFREFIRRWGEIHPEATVVLLGGDSERQRIAAITDGLTGCILNLAGRLDLRRSIAVLSHCRLFIGNDSGLMHIAAALDLPLAAVFGPTAPGRTAPLADRFRLLHHGADCAPCRHRECPSDHRCMTAVGIDEVLEAAVELWEDGK